MAIQDSNSLILRPPVPLIPFPPFEDELPPPPRPFDPGPPVDNSDLMAQINALLAPPDTPASQPMGIGGVLKALLAQLPQAVAVGMSKDPAAALGKQLEEMRAVAFQREQQAQARKDRLDDLRRTVGIDLARGEIEQRRQLGKESRQYRQQVELTMQDQAFRRGERQEEAESRFQLAELEQRGRERLQQLGFDQAKFLADQNYEREVGFKAVQEAAKYAAMGMDGNIAYDLAKRALRGEMNVSDRKAVKDMYAREFAELQLERKLGRKLTQAQINNLNAEAAAKRAAARAKDDGIAGEMFKVYQKGLEDAVKTANVVLSDGTVTERASLSEAQKLMVTRTLTQEENIVRYMNGPGKILLSMSAQGFGQRMTTVTGAGKEAIAKQLDAQIKQYRDSKNSDESIIKGLIEYGKASGNSQDVLDAIIRNKMEGGANKAAGAEAQPTPSPTPTVNSIVPGQGPLARGLRWVEQKMAELDQKVNQSIEQSNEEMRKRGFDPRTRRPLGEKLTPAPASGPTALGILPDFDPGALRRLIDRFDFPLKVPDHYADDLNPGAIGRYLERLMGMPTPEDEKDFRKEMKALGEAASKRKKGDQKAKK